MNTLTFLTRVKAILIAKTWTGAGGEVVFPSGGVIIAAAIEEDALLSIRTPCAIIVPTDAEMDGQIRGLIKQRFGVRIIVTNKNDPYGEATLMGANIGSTLKSQGRGLFAIEEELLNAIKYLQSTDSIKIIERYRSAPATVYNNRVPYSLRDYAFEVVLTANA